MNVSLNNTLLFLQYTFQFGCCEFCVNGIILYPFLSVLLLLPNFLFFLSVGGEMRLYVICFHCCVNIPPFIFIFCSDGHLDQFQFLL